MRSLVISPAQQRRLERLARLAGRTPQSMLRFVLRDGFEATERDVIETIEADRDADRSGAIPNDEVMGRARTIIERHAAKRPRKAA
ncbi:MAG: hypothetical protein HY525_04375 [Betaproteobacteria bacterium]|nr:hypothetical protein [Betaproteobacteria bacterium]